MTVRAGGLTRVHDPMPPARAKQGYTYLYPPSEREVGGRKNNTACVAMVVLLRGVLAVEVE